MIVEFYNVADWLFLSLIKKPVERPILFTTEDGVNVYAGDKWVSVQKGTFDILTDCIYEMKYPASWLYFSTKEAAELFRLENKPCLSVNDFKSCSSEIERLNEDNPHFMKLIELAKTKI